MREEGKELREEGEGLRRREINVTHHQLDSTMTTESGLKGFDSKQVLGLIVGLD